MTSEKSSTAVATSQADLIIAAVAAVDSINNHRLPRTQSSTSSSGLGGCRRSSHHHHNNNDNSNSNDQITNGESLTNSSHTVHSNCSSSDRFQEFLQELELYQDDEDIDDIHNHTINHHCQQQNHSPNTIRIPTAGFDSSFESASNDADNEYVRQSIASFRGSSPLLERLKRFNIGTNDNINETTEDISTTTALQEQDCCHGNNSSSSNSLYLHHQNGSSEMWSVEQSRVSAGSSSLSERHLLSSKTFYQHYQQRPGHSCNSRNVPCRVEHVLDFVKTPEPALLGHVPTQLLEPLIGKKANLQKQMLFADLSRQIFPDRVVNRVVYDLDELTKNTPPITPNVSAVNLLPSPLCSSSSSTNRIVPVLRKSQSAPKLSLLRGASYGPLKEDIANTKPLSFESRFECGNLRKAMQMRHYEYDLILNSDTNTSNHHQWFYFQVQEMESGVDYRFNIINCEKANSQFNFGMQPVMYSVASAKQGSPCWERTGTSICYYRNYFTRGVGSTKSYFTATFTISFPHKNDTCFIAYHYPYSLSMLKTDLLRVERTLCPQIIFTNQSICRTLGGNDVTLLTITNPSSSGARRDILKRPYVMLTGRVHPGETNSSWMMKGILEFLTSSDTLARQLRSIYIFKIVPMLNPDGVVNGCHRCSLTGQDLNRQWKHPDPVLHPTIYHVKTLMETMTRRGKKPILFVDFHGHSRKKNVFMYGCQEKQNSDTSEMECTTTTSTGSAAVKSPPSFSTSSSKDETAHVSYCSSVDFYNEDCTAKLFPRILSSVSPYFALQNCSYVMEKSKEATARIVGYRELGIERSYTLESSYCGMDQGEFAGYHIGTNQLEDMGRTFCKALFKFALCPSVDVVDFFPN